MTDEEFIRHYLRWLSVRSFQTINIDEGDLHKMIFPPTPQKIEVVNSRPQLTRQGAFEEWSTHLPHY